ncbi:sensor domain-containing protein [Tepidicella xavieri]|uniref:PAS domain S-box-containing protein/diguanylate cyclase (GGDEF)-like protein n=1 Tax=Tepidicella xavieri TaxID=360241 RepID=A0A4R6UCL0_9BURK|nr:EAL domain-containing protein [Tepidicella xavieri]TDQ43732.1 PAS domain S-box-containing protein/diguanylate cyclase (GGDEF)-like protein [Tepidicella xavieri]
MFDPLSAAGLLLAVIATGGWWHERRQRRRAEARMLPERQRFSELLERLGIGHWIRDLETQEMWWSSSFRRQHGMAEDLPAHRRHMLDILHPDDRATFAERLGAAYAQGEGETTYRSIADDGAVRHHVVRIAVATDPETGHRLAYGFNLDITEHVQLQRTLQERTAYLEAIVGHLPMGLSVFDDQLRLKVWNAEFTKVLDLPADLVREGVDFSELIRVPAQRGEYGEGDIEAMVRQRRELALRFQAHRFERTRPNGRTHLVIGEPILHEGQVTGFVTTYTDITEQKLERERLEQTSDRLRTLIEHIPAGVTMVDRQLQIVAWNDRLRELLDIPEELFRQPVVSLESMFRFNVMRGEYGPCEDPEAMVQALLDRARDFQPHAFERTRPNGRVLYIQGQPLATGGFVTVYTDVTEQKHHEAEVERLARTDPLTGLDHRGAFTIGLRQALAQAERHGGQMAVLFIDMDRFKAINDSLGHEVGDVVLIEMARRLRERLRQSDIVARIGGDEFVVALTGIEAGLDAAQVATQLLQALSAPYDTPRGPVHLSPSIGIALYPQDGLEENELLRLADLAMYHVKNEGGAGYRFYAPDMNEAVIRRIEFEHRLRAALQAHQLELHYQPIHRLSDGLPLLGFEALLRWPQGDGRYIPPDQFIPIAEESDLIEHLGLWVCQQVARQSRLWREQGLQPTTEAWRIGINLSARQFDRADLVDRLASCFAQEGLGLDGVTFEITEGAMMRDPQRAEQQLQTLRSHGAQCAVDDFGTGYSSLSYLRHFAIDHLKIDKSFVHALSPHPDDLAIISAAIGLAHQLGHQTVAEGVETVEQLACLQRLGCDAVQGYLLSRPMQAAEVPGYLERVARGDHQPSVRLSA